MKWWHELNVTDRIIMLSFKALTQPIYTTIRNGVCELGIEICACMRIKPESVWFLCFSLRDGILFFSPNVLALKLVQMLTKYQSRSKYVHAHSQSSKCNQIHCMCNVAVAVVSMLIRITRTCNAMRCNGFGKTPSETKRKKIIIVLSSVK